MSEDRDYRRCHHCNRLRKTSWFMREKNGRKGCICGSRFVREPANVEWYERILLMLGII
jgi:hypothetical protein